MNVYPLLLGEFEARDNTTFRGGDPSKIVWYSSYAYLIEGASKPILVDTGYADPQICKERMNHLCRRSEEMTIEKRLAAFGLSVDDIQTVVLSHCHWDHIGGLDKFKNAQVYCQRAEVSWSVNPPDYMASAYPKVLSGRLPELKERLVIIDGDYTIERGIKLNKVAAHSPGTQMVEVIGETKRVIITSDAMLHYDNFEKNIPIGTYHNLEEAIAVLDMLREKVLSPKETILLASHDPKVWQLYHEGVSV